METAQWVNPLPYKCKEDLNSKPHWATTKKESPGEGVRLAMTTEESRRQDHRTGWKARNDTHDVHTREAGVLELSLSPPNPHPTHRIFLKERISCHDEPITLCANLNNILKYDLPNSTSLQYYFRLLSPSQIKNFQNQTFANISLPFERMWGALRIQPRAF